MTDRQACLDWGLDQLRRNPHVAAKFFHLADRYWNHRGGARIGSFLILNVLRWHMAFDTEGEFKVANEWGPFLSRLYAAMHPDRSELFDTKASKWDALSAFDWRVLHGTFINAYAERVREERPAPKEVA